jgi:hypothetical protein
MTVFNPDKIDEILEKVDKLIAMKKQQVDLMYELRGSLVHECSKHLDNDKARAVFITEKERQLSDLGVRVSPTGKMFSKSNGKPYGHGFYNPEAEHVLSEIKRAMAIQKEKHGQRQEEHAPDRVGEGRDQT